MLSWKLFVLVAVLTVSVAGVAGATPATSGFTELSVSTDFVVVPKLTLDGWLAHQYSMRWGLAAFLLVTSGWAEAYAGPTLKPAEWAQMWLMAGAEQSGGGIDPRYSTGVWIGKNRYAFWGAVELDNATFTGDLTGLWYDLNVIYRPVSWLDIGIKDRRTIGLGLQVRGHIGPTEPWCAWAPIDLELARWQPDRLTCGIKLNL